MNESTFAPKYVQRMTRKESPLRVEKFLGEEWIAMSHWPNDPDEAKLQRHVRALGGSVRMVRDGLPVREWRNGQEIEP